jgi:hypothetical protein
MGGIAMKRLFGFLLLVGIAGGLSDCTSQGSGSSPQSSLTAARQQLVADLQQCTQTYDYDPRNVAGVPENKLAPNELEWRQCGYDAVRKYSHTQPTLSGRYDQLINEDITMTNAVQAGTMTRSQRRERLQTLIEQIKRAEESQAEAAAGDQAQQMEDVRRVVDGMRGFY